MKDIEHVSNEDLALIGQYCNENELLLNLKNGTTKQLKFHGRNLIIKLNGTCINLVTEYVLQRLNAIQRNRLFGSRFKFSSPPEKQLLNQPFLNWKNKGFFAFWQILVLKG